MTREIKFRAWDNRYKTMHDYFSSFNNFVDFYYEAHKDDELKLMQYTGLKDKNGKEIYEGDIIKGVFEDNRKIKISGAVSFWKKGLAWAVGANTESAYYLASVANLEVIGNVYENKELLK